MKKVILTIFTFIICLSMSFSQSIKPKDLVANQSSFNNVDIFISSTEKTTNSNLTKLDDYHLLDLEKTVLSDLNKSAPEALLLKIPISKSVDLELQLVKVNIFSDDFQAFEEPAHQLISSDPGQHFRGIVKGNPNSLVSISIYKDEVAGFISDPINEGNYVIGKLQEQSKNAKHIVYLDTDLQFEQGRICDTDDIGEPYDKEDLQDIPPTKALSDCVRLLLEVDYNLHQTLGSSVTNSNNYINTLFNQISTIYAGEDINTVLSESFVWSSPSPYTGSSTGAKLNSFQANRNNFNADFAQLLTNINFGGLAATIDGMCGTENNRMCVSGVLNQLQTVPTYSFDVEIACHEYGHLFGSFHTHGCYWNGNNTQIDDCGNVLQNNNGQTPEGNGCFNASNPIYPSNGGTVMSYCYGVGGVGVNFANGFGDQPGNAIRNVVASATCLQSCSNESCSDNEVSLTILTDNYPGETTWTIKDGGTTVASGGPYSNANTSFTESICLLDGCYTFTINDSYGDGICCAFGNGSYTLTASDGSVIKQGGNFTSSESTDFCEPTGGSSSNCVEIDFNTYPPSAYGAGQDNGTVNVIQGGDGISIFNNGWKDINIDYTVTAQTTIQFDFGSTQQGEIHGIGFDNNDGISSGFTFQLYGTQNWGNRDFDYTSPGSWQTFTIPVGSYYTGSFNRMFFVDDHDASPSNGNSYFRNVKIFEGSSCNPALTENHSEIITRNKTDMIHGLPDETIASEMLIYPNPASDLLNLQFDYLLESSGTIQLINVLGQIVKTENLSFIEGENSVRLDISNIQSGSYFVKVKTDNQEFLQRINVIQ